MDSPTNATRPTLPPATSTERSASGPIRDTTPSRFVHATGELAAALGRWTGTTAAFAWAVLAVAVWALSGPVLRYSNAWQLVINTGTNIITFLMVFLLQRAQNKDALAIHLKLDELVAAMKGASNRLINIEHLSETDLEALKRSYGELVATTAHEDKLSSTSVEDVHDRGNARR